MKGYSFDELVKLAEAAVRRAGDTMTGNLTVPAVDLSGSQTTAPNTVTRKDYVDGELAKKVSKTGDTMTGNLTAPAVLVSSAQNTSANALTRKDYVDGEIAKQVSKTGDTMTGNLTTPKVLVSNAQGTEVNALTRKDYVDAELAKKLNLTGGTLAGDLTAPAVLVSSAQNTSVNALTRKDYVDGQVATRAPTAHTHTAADVGALPAGGTAVAAGKLATPRGINGTNFDGTANITTANWGTARTLTIGNAGKSVDGAGNVVWSLAEIGAAPSGFGLGDYCPHAFGDLNTVLRTKSGFYDASSSDITNGFQPNHWCYYMNMAHGNSAGYNGMLAMSFDGAHIGFKTIEGGYDKGWKTIYHTGNQPHYSHNHSAAQGNSDIVAGGYGQVGTYMFAQVSTGGAPPTHDIHVGGFVAGSNLRPCSVDSEEDDMSPVALPGAWKCLGRSRFGNGETDRTAAKTLWIRVS